MLFPGVTQGTLFVTDTPTNKVYEVRLTGLDPNTPIISLGDFGEVATVNPLTGVVETPLLTGLTAPHGLDFIPFAVAGVVDLGDVAPWLRWPRLCRLSQSSPPNRLVNPVG